MTTDEQILKNGGMITDKGEKSPNTKKNLPLCITNCICITTGAKPGTGAGKAVTNRLS
jgi:hypothetical protein